jgi:hypothetical protein
MGVVPQDSLCSLGAGPGCVVWCGVVWCGQEPLTPIGTGAYLDRTTQITRERMGKGNLGHCEGSGHHLGLLSTGSGELSIKLALDYSQTVLVSFPMSYDGDDQSGCHKLAEKKSKSQMNAHRQTH